MDAAMLDALLWPQPALGCRFGPLYSWVCLKTKDLSPSGLFHSVSFKTVHQKSFFPLETDPHGGGTLAFEIAIDVGK